MMRHISLALNTQLSVGEATTEKAIAQVSATAKGGDAEMEAPVGGTDVNNMTWMAYDGDDEKQLGMMKSKHRRARPAQEGEVHDRDATLEER
ncbi:hypothetical protein CYMTET_22368 [Cymbomonas tetramitiformis]|uniref:Uncharacterized protein n=1 Tax=Cymbomonas tetramitiformis TaxID=36881 RepID=A0AAE0G016_9CHLO|nr:hypothetical protein CYMTET_22368 [Cymbomonas tetramitiformis]